MCDFGISPEIAHLSILDMVGIMIALDINP